MENTISIQLYSLFLFIIAGIVIGTFFDVFRILRRTFRTPDWMTYLEDILFWILTGIFLLFLLFYFQNGKIRGYIIVGLFFGILIYMLTISRYFIKISVHILTIIKNVIKQIFIWCGKPFTFIYKILKRIVLKPFSFIIINFKKVNSTFSHVKELYIFSMKNRKLIKKRRNLQKNVEKYN